MEKTGKKPLLPVLFIVMAGILIAGSLQATNITPRREQNTTDSIKAIGTSMAGDEDFHVIGGDGYDISQDIFFDDEGNIYSAGYTDSSGAGGYDYYVFKTNHNGELIWERTWGGVANDIGNAIWVDDSENVFVCGTTSSYGTGGDVAIVKWNAYGEFQWYRTWGGPGSDVGYCIYADVSGIYVSGKSDSWQTSEQGLVIKWGTGNPPAISWNYTFGTIYRDRCYAIFVYSTTVYLTGYMGAGASDNQVFLREYTTAGVYSATYYWNGPGNDEALAMWIDSTQNIFVCGQTDSWHATDYQAFIIRWTTAGVITWNKTISNWDSFDDIWVVDNNAGYFFNMDNVYCSCGGNVIYRCFKANGYGLGTLTVKGGDLSPICSSVMGCKYGVVASGSVHYNYYDAALQIWQSNPCITDRPLALITYPYDEGPSPPSHQVSWDWIDLTPENSFWQFVIDSVVINTQYYTMNGTYGPYLPRLSVGDHLVEFNLQDDTHTWKVYDYITVRVTNDLPVISGVMNQTYSVGTTGHVLIVYIDDKSIDVDGYYRARLDGYVVNMGVLSEGAIPINLDGLSIGTHALNVSVDDGFGGKASRVASITVTNAAPVISNLGDTSYVVGTGGHFMSWTVTDLGGYKVPWYNVSIDGKNFTTGAWTSNAPIMVNIDGLSLGVHVISITAFDGYGKNVSDTVDCTVTNIVPLISKHADINYDAGTMGHYITWTPVDDSINNQANFVIQCNGTAIDSGSWTNGTPIIANVDGLAPGAYNFTITIHDGYGGFTSDSVIVEVSNIKPQISQLMDITYTQGELDNAIIWYVLDQDVNFTSYYIMRDGYQVASGTWRSALAIKINIDGLPSGTYNFTIVALDGFGASIQDSVSVHVMPSSSDPSNPSVMNSIVQSMQAITACVVIITILLAIMAFMRKDWKKKGGTGRDRDASTIQPASRDPEAKIETTKTTLANNAIETEQQPAAPALDRSQEPSVKPKRQRNSTKKHEQAE